jgi:hypothetical protein
MKKHIYNFWLVSLLLAPIVLWILPADFFDNGADICPSKIFFHVECFGCGITRAVMHLHHFEFEEAIYYNYGVVVVYPLLFIIWIKWTKDALQHAVWGKYLSKILLSRNS